MAHKAGLRGSAVIAAVAAAVTLAACGSNSSGSSSSNGSSGPVKLTIAVAATVGDFAPLYVAESQGYFVKNGVDLTVIPNALANTLPYLTSGRADLAMYSATIALSAAEQGKATSIVLLTERQPGFALVGSKSTTSLSQLKSESNCRYGVPQQGTSGYGVAATLFAKLGLHCQFVITPDPATMVAEIDSGSMNAGVLLASNADQAKSQGATILIDPRNAADRQKYFTEQTPTASVFGVTANLHKKRQGVVGFIKAMNDACVYIDSHSDAEVVADLIKADSTFATTPTPTLIANFASSQRPYMCQGLVGPVLGDRIGYISKSAWNTALQTYKAFGITGFDTSAAVNSYSERVDMSYYNSAVSAKS